ncbi:uncharacterized protein [Elaeis guineensis]|uniref:Uncharacterized protein LOC105035750 isoform X1 n=1 Tax=Elaeis guineensis var. tenera TaxID=51953 RepID=A0A6J0PDC1_ELAGV|nr:uncharacterized protein LOC105035750 isoform X1 [Elaeis guineensis]XP_019702980.1 uncharacterized protein LOC105035750 isoform X1 [Elaeis guineensis]XP_019702981.1 uncharacterized protein LOC105035750 isoform X1 [Elaeis guineensis]XP_019702982.1 uncharacterized protein LOC105035750 isoform X1 [Elaeis guineensis]XP_019702985.1 uncharacterized protein LOC105035750 isoform X1 [Elaeis guineensis]XP_019702986.1 uncharacterized protein LOC105035750 isoform X1 [Elaeis guineensis]XP_029117872.1 un
MDFEHELPFEAGQEAESKCFIEGFRGAWFRCKITKIGSRKGHIGYYLEFFDFPDERITWTRLYQKSPQPIKSGGESKMELMVRPTFPPIYRENQLPDSNLKADVVAIVNDTWKVGDLVDWWYDSCYWSGRITQLLGDDKVLVELLEPPLGEGRSYVSSCKDLRPSLDWSPENGWMVPISRNYGDSHYSARLVRPHNEGVERIVTSVDLKREEKPDFLNKESILNNEMKDVPQELIKTSSRKDCMSSSDSEKIQISEGNCVTSSKDASDALLKTSSRKDQLNSLDSVGKIWISESNYVTSRRHPDTIESSIIELEEVANKIKWLKGFLRYGFRWSNKMKPSWRFVEK